MEDTDEPRAPDEEGAWEKGPPFRAITIRLSRPLEPGEEPALVYAGLDETEQEMLKWICSGAIGHIALALDSMLRSRSAMDEARTKHDAGELDQEEFIKILLKHCPAGEWKNGFKRYIRSEKLVPEEFLDEEDRKDAEIQEGKDRKDAEDFLKATEEAKERLERPKPEEEKLLENPGGLSISLDDLESTGPPQVGGVEATISPEPTPETGSISEPEETASLLQNEERKIPEMSKRPKIDWGISWN